MGLTLDPKIIQGDILSGLAKKKETFYFFQINSNNVPGFQKQLATFVPLVTTSAKADDCRKDIRKAKEEAARKGEKCPLIEISGVNISFSQKGLNVLGIKDDIGDEDFKNGMLSEIDVLGDVLQDWDPAFQKDIHGVILVAANCKSVLDQTLDHIKKIFKVGDAQAGIIEIKTLEGSTRPDEEDGHEHFGFNDGLSQPSIKDFDTDPQPGQKTIDSGVILLGRDGDAKKDTRPSWACEGSFLAFRYLRQLVPEFNKFLEDNILVIDGTPVPELLGARMVGRWKSGASVQQTPTQDDPEFVDPSVNQAFTHDKNSQVMCPFAAHTRKTNPRGDIPDSAIAPSRILRRGIPFGPEVTDEEKAAKKSSDDEKLERGLLFACYQSNLDKGFRFVQQSWANNANFPPQKQNGIPKVDQPGIDPLIGVGTPRQMAGSNPDINAANTNLPFDAKWVISRGGEYFFSPSIPALKDTFAAKATPAEL
ncbi:uncharacterized protein JN550_011250 [Neoarthrinium moseri]|uniref:uncharacterized protein n=1 Tax=Neoarthrinium moseri TaxID=1658444 RepID=UPI001FDBAAD3|nr:uncharacterized protein JN550_011250 [Neoarthrinium moseri]KAI1860788.1 hypothetical protein JN550_011250 [Neoarthrinium moseri]